MKLEYRILRYQTASDTEQELVSLGTEHLQTTMECFKFTIPLNGTYTTRMLYFSGNIILALTAFLGNGVVIYLVWYNTKLHRPTYYFMSALALSDFTTAFLGQLTFCIEVTFKQFTSCTYDKVIAFFNASSCSSSLFLLCLIARDRYIHVAKRTLYQSHMSKTYSKRASAACFLVGIFVATLFVIEDRFTRVVSTLAFAVVASSCFTFIAVHSKRILRIVGDHIRHMHESMPKEATARQKGNVQTSEAMERAINRSIFSVIALYFFAWSPVIILMLIFTYHNIKGEHIGEGYRYAFAWCSFVSYFNGALNPMIYSYRCDAIGQEMRKLVRRFFCLKSFMAVENSETIPSSEKKTVQKRAPNEK